MFRLDGKVAIVTGGGAGIGRATACLMASAGARILVADISAQQAAQTADAIRAQGGTAEVAVTDVSDESQVSGMVHSAVDAFGRLDILHNNAAAVDREFLAADQGITDTAAEVWQKTFSVNVMGTVFGCKYAIPAMIESGGGSIINTSSTMARVASTGKTAYGSLKVAIETLTKYVAVQHGKSGIRCNAVAPGPIYTHARPAELDALLMANASTPFLGQPDDLAHVVAFLASDEARYVTGQTFPVDGGSDIAHGPVTIGRVESASKF